MPASVSAADWATAPASANVSALGVVDYILEHAATLHIPPGPPEVKAIDSSVHQLTSSHRMTNTGIRIAQTTTDAMILLRFLDGFSYP